MKWFKKWWWTAIILAIALIIGWEEKRCQAQAYQCRASYAAQAQSERLPGNISVYQQASEDQAIAAACEPNGYFCRLFGPANLPTVLLVFLGIGAIWAALRTLRAIEKQAEAMINSERAWIDGDVIGRKIPAVGVIRYSLKVTNHGKTPARLIGYDIEHGFQSEGADFSSKTLATHFSEEAYFLLGGGETKTIRDDFDMDDIFANPKGELSGAMRVTIKYRDIVTVDQKLHETILHFRYNLILSDLKPMYEYNQYTDQNPN